jgi:hypothetical protein
MGDVGVDTEEYSEPVAILEVVVIELITDLYIIFKYKFQFNKLLIYIEIHCIYKKENMICEKNPHPILKGLGVGFFRPVTSLLGFLSRHYELGHTY